MKALLPLLLLTTLLAGCSPETRCVRGIESAQKELDAVRETKSGLAKASPSLLKASALLGAADVARAAKNYDGCISNLSDAREAIDAARD